MADQIIQAWGPRTASVERSTALEQLQAAPGFPKGAIVHDFREENGRWLAEVRLAETKEAAPPFPPKEAPTDDEAPSPEPPDEEAPAEPEEKEEPKDEKPKDEGEKPKDEGKKGVEGILEELTPLIHAIADKLGVGAPGEDSPVPGLDDLGDVPPPPEGAPGPPTKAPGPAGPHPSKLKPGEVPNRPGVTPIGSPAFASTQVPEDHPWHDLIGKVATITVSEPTDMPLKEANQELKALAEPYGYHVRRMREDTEDGQRVVRALISRR